MDSAACDALLARLPTRALLDAARDLVFIADAGTGELIDANAAACAALGRERTWFPGRHQTELHPREILERTAEQFRDIADGRRSTPVESVLLCADGRRIPVEVSDARIVHDGRQLVLGVFRPITERERAERLLVESEQRFGALFQAAPMGQYLYRLDGDGALVLIDANPAADRMTGIDNRPLIGQRIEDAFPALVGTPIPGAFRAIAAGGAPQQWTDFAYRHGGIDSCFDVHAYPVGAGCMAVSFVDVGERRRAAAVARQAERLDAMARLANGVAHDFNNLLGSIGYGELLAQSATDERRQRQAESILTAARRASELTRRLVAGARQGKYLNVPVDLHDVITAAVAAGIAPVERHALTGDAVVPGDPTQLRALVADLLRGAAAALPPGDALHLSSAVVNLLETDCRRLGPLLKPGPHLRIAVGASRVFRDDLTARLGRDDDVLAAALGAAEAHQGALRADDGVPGAAAAAEPGRRRDGAGRRRCRPARAGGR